MVSHSLGLIFDTHLFVFQFYKQLLCTRKLRLYFLGRNILAEKTVIKMFMKLTTNHFELRPSV